jgi:hypothetical protein
MAAPHQSVARCVRCPEPATSVADVTIGRRVFELALCRRHRRELLHGARRRRPA